LANVAYAGGKGAHKLRGEVENYLDKGTFDPDKLVANGVAQARSIAESAARKGADKLYSRGMESGAVPAFLNTLAGVAGVPLVGGFSGMMLGGAGGQLAFGDSDKLTYEQRQRRAGLRKLLAAAGAMAGGGAGYFAAPAVTKWMTKRMPEALGSLVYDTKTRKLIPKK